jgi:hypothetical protein
MGEDSETGVTRIRCMPGAPVTNLRPLRATALRAVRKCSLGSFHTPRRSNSPAILADERQINASEVRQIAIAPTSNSNTTSSAGCPGHKAPCAACHGSVSRAQTFPWLLSHAASIQPAGHPRRRTPDQCLESPSNRQGGMSAVVGRVPRSQSSVRCVPRLCEPCANVATRAFAVRVNPPAGHPPEGFPDHPPTPRKSLNPSH